jgi:hypothetical protein
VRRWVSRVISNLVSAVGGANSKRVLAPVSGLALTKPEPTQWPAALLDA